METYTIPKPMMADLVDFIRTSSFTIKRAGEEVDVLRQQQKRAEDMRPAILDHMLKSGMVAEEQRKEAEILLASHAETLGLLKSAIDIIVKQRNDQTVKAASALGQGEDPPQPTQNTDGSWSLTSAFPGRPTTQKKASDMALLSILD